MPITLAFLTLWREGPLLLSLPLTPHLRQPNGSSHLAGSPLASSSSSSATDVLTNASVVDKTFDERSRHRVSSSRGPRWSNLLLRDRDETNEVVGRERDGLLVLLLMSCFRPVAKSRHTQAEALLRILR